MEKKELSAEKTNLDWKDGDIMNTVDKEGKLHHFVLRDMMPEDTPEEKYKKGDKVKLTLADKDGWITGEFEVAGVEVEQPEEKEEGGCKGFWSYYRNKGDDRELAYLIVDGEKFLSEESVKNLLSERERFNKEELEYLNACVGIVWNKWKIKDKKPNDIMLERLKLKLKKLSKLTTK